MACIPPDQSFVRPPPYWRCSTPVTPSETLSAAELSEPRAGPIPAPTTPASISSGSVRASRFSA
ncbi:putative proline-rich receptor-like protein kinase PERK8 [Iris pallida]|uniref:Proline-rich receptor-like protein kinase PERK8 n=1 Tax=Iris pallida TaxID=29817 RepID=A0AAX6FGT5_IRIPA|nr:putative proline-rich receptor-like protein kinase PERK8 [Iris pallida]